MKLKKTDLKPSGSTCLVVSRSGVITARAVCVSLPSSVHHAVAALRKDGVARSLNEILMLGYHYWKYSGIKPGVAVGGAYPGLAESLTTRINPDELLRLDEFAAGHGMTRSDAVAHLVEVARLARFGGLRKRPDSGKEIVGFRSVPVPVFARET